MLMCACLLKCGPSGGLTSAVDVPVHRREFSDGCHECFFFRDDRVVDSPDRRGRRGLAGRVVFGVLMQMMGMVAMLVGGSPSPWAGWCIWRSRRSYDKIFCLAEVDIFADLSPEEMDAIATAASSCSTSTAWLPKPATDAWVFTIP